MLDQGDISELSSQKVTETHVEVILRDFKSKRKSCIDKYQRALEKKRGNRYTKEEVKYLVVGPGYPGLKYCQLAQVGLLLYVGT